MPQTPTPPTPPTRSPAKAFGSDTVTRPQGVRVRVAPFYVPEQSDPDDRKYFFAYRITITNQGPKTVQVLSRHWIIIDADGHREEVRGAGVVGESPIIEAGASYTYSSACPLETSWGTMEGTYQMRDSDGQKFDARIGRFVLTMDAKEPKVRSQSSEPV